MNLASSRRQQFTTENAKTHVTFVINPEISLHSYDEFSIK